MIPGAAVQCKQLANMATAVSAFPDLDLALAVSRVEVVSNVEIETIKTALRWLFDEAQHQRQKADTSDTPATQKQIDDLHRLIQEQKTFVNSLQDQQVGNDSTVPMRPMPQHSVEQHTGTLPRNQQGAFVRHRAPLSARADAATLGRHKPADCVLCRTSCCKSLRKLSKL